MVEADGLGGACVLTDCVPSKTLIATSETMGILAGSAGLGIRIEGYDGRMRPRPGAPAGPVTVDAARLNGRVKALAVAQSADVAARLAAEGVEVIAGRGRLAGPHTVVADDREISAGVVLLATGGVPRQLPGAEPDGERILNWRQLYDLAELPGGADRGRLRGDRRRVRQRLPGAGLPGHADLLARPGAAERGPGRGDGGGRRVPAARDDGAQPVPRRGVKREGRGVVVTLADGRTVRGSHCLLTVGVVPATQRPGARTRRE